MAFYSNSYTLLYSNSCDTFQTIQTSLATPHGPPTQTKFWGFKLTLGLFSPRKDRKGSSVLSPSSSFYNFPSKSAWGNTTIQPASRPITTALGVWPLFLGLMSQAHCTFTVSGTAQLSTLTVHTLFVLFHCSAWKQFYINTQKTMLSFSSLLLKTSSLYHVYKTQGTEVIRLLGIN